MKIFSLIILFVCFGQTYSQTITTLSPTQTSTCAGGNIIVQYETTGTFDLICTFTAQLSDEWGNFTNAVPIGSVPVNTGVIFGTIPSNTTFGVGYRVRVVSSNPYVVGTENPFPPIIITSSAISATIFVDPGEEVCYGDSITLSVLPNESYIWSTGETTQEITVGQSGTYVVTVTNYITGCEVTAPPVEIIVDPLPVVDLGPDPDRCDGSVVTLDAGSGYVSYDWNDGTWDTQTIDVTQTGTFSVLVVDTNDCENGDTINISFHPNPQVNLGSDTVLCSNEYTVSVPPVFTSYNWNNGLSYNPSLTVEQSGAYHIVVINEWTCTGADTVYVQLYPIPSIEMGNDVYACEPPVILNAGYGFSHYDWNSGADTAQFHYVHATGVQYLTVTDSNGCSANDSLYVGIFGIPQVDLGQLIVANAHDTITLDAGPGSTYYFWSTGDTTQTITIYCDNNSAGIYFYSVIVVNEYGCSNTDDVALQILEPIFVESSLLSRTIVYPNPFTDMVFLEAQAELSATLNDISGKTLFTYPISRGLNKLDVSGISEGFYLFKVYDSKGAVKIFKLTKSSH